jgi:hypothetical protein
MGSGLLSYLCTLNDMVSPSRFSVDVPANKFAGSAYDTQPGFGFSRMHQC